MVHSPRGENWGGPGGSVTVGLVGNVPAIPLPHPDISTTSRVVDNTKGLYNGRATENRAASAGCVADSEVQGSEAAAKDSAKTYAIAESDAATQGHSASFEDSGESHAATAERGSLRQRRRADDSNVIVRHGPGKHAGRAGFNGAGGGDFGSRFSWYVEAVQRRISSNWLQSTVDPSVSAAPRVVVVRSPFCATAR